MPNDSAAAPAPTPAADAAAPAPATGTAPAAAPAVTNTPAAPAAAPAPAPAADGTAPAADGGKQAGGDDAPAGAPEQYADFKAPDGVALDSAVMTEFAGIAKELNLTQDAAQKMVEKVAPVLAQRQQAQIETLKTEWQQAAKADPEYGGDKFDTSLATAQRALKTFGSDAFTKMLNESGMGNHPEVIRFMVKAGQSISEDTHVAAGATLQSAKTAAQRLYPEKS